MTDFNYDKENLLEVTDCKKYYWYLRECGTELLNSNDIKYKETWDYTTAKYWLSEAIKIYEINVDKIGNKNVYGTIKEIKKDQMQELINNAIEMDEQTSFKYVNDSLQFMIKNNKTIESIKQGLYKACEFYHYSDYRIERIIENSRSQLQDIVNCFKNISMDYAV